MPSTRYFLIDEKTNAEWDFQPENHDGQLQNIDGIGFEKTKVYSEVSDFFITTQSGFNQNAITGEITFLTEKRYVEFLPFAESDSLVLKRVSPLNDTIFLDISVDSFKKNDADRFNEEISFCDITFVAQSPWYRSKKTYEFKPITNPTKTYSYVHPFQYISQTRSRYTLINNSKSDAVIIIYIYGASKNPKWEYSDLEGNVISGNYIGTVANGQYLKIDATPNNLEAAVYNYYTSEKIRDVYQNCNLSLDTFVTMSPGVGYFSITDDDTDKVVSRIEVKEIERCP